MLFQVLLGVSVLVNLFLAYKFITWKYSAINIHNKFAPRLDTALEMLLEVTGKEKMECVVAIETICRMPNEMKAKAVEHFADSKAKARLGFH